MSDKRPFDEQQVTAIATNAGFSVGYVYIQDGLIKIDTHGTLDGITFAMLEELAEAFGTKDINLGDEHGYYAGEHDSWVEILNPKAKS